MTVAQLPALVAEINWDDNPSIEFPPTGYTDISSRVRGFSIRRGRSNFVDRVEAGTASLLLDNRDGYFNFTQPGRLLLRRIRLRALYAGVYYPLITGHVEAYHHSYPGIDKDAVCEVIVVDGMKILAQQQFRQDYVRENESPAARVASALTEAGIGSSYQSVVNVVGTEIAPVRVVIPEPAPTQTLTATLTHGGNTVAIANTYGLLPGTPIVAPGIPVGNVVGAVTGPTTFTLHNDKFDPVTALDRAYLTRTKDTQYPGNPGPWYEIDGISFTEDLSVGMKVGPYNNISGQQLFNHIITGITDVSVSVATAITQTWRGPSDPGGIATGVPFSAPSGCTITVPRQYLLVASILDHIRQIEATERGTFLVLGDGTYQYQGANYRPTQTVQLTFGEHAGEVPYVDAPVTYDDANLANEYVLNNVYNQTVTVISDAASKTKYFKRTAQIDQIFYAPVSSLPTDQRVFEPLPRMEGLRPQPRVDPATLWPRLLELDVSDKVSIRRRPLGGSDIFSAYDQFVEGINHDGNPGDWQISFVTSPVRT